MKATVAAAVRLARFEEVTPKAAKSGNFTNSAALKARKANLKARSFQVTNKFSGKVVATFKYLACAKKEMELWNNMHTKPVYSIVEVKRTTIIK